MPPEPGRSRWWLAAVESGTFSDRGHDRPLHRGRADLARDSAARVSVWMWCWPTATFCVIPWSATCWPPGCTSCGGPPRVSADPYPGAGRRKLPGPAAPVAQGRRAAHRCESRLTLLLRQHRCCRRGLLRCSAAPLLHIEAFPALAWPAPTRSVGVRDRDWAPQDRHGPGHGRRRPNSKNPQGLPRRSWPSSLRGRPGHPHPDRRRGRRPTGIAAKHPTAFPARPGRRDRLVTVAFPSPG